MRPVPIVSKCEAPRSEPRRRPRLRPPLPARRWRCRDMTAAPNKCRWDLFPHFVLRRAGFAFDLVAGLSLSTSTESLAALADNDGIIDAAVATWNKTVFPTLL